jgi:hypothetical protein
MFFLSSNDKITIYVEYLPYVFLYLLEGISRKEKGFHCREDFSNRSICFFQKWLGRHGDARLASIILGIPLLSLCRILTLEKGRN